MDTIDIEQGAGQVSKALKIKDERAEELKELCCESVAKFETIPEVMDLMQMIAKNNNELAYCNYRIGICSRCPASSIRKQYMKDEDIEDSLGKFWKDNKGKDNDKA